VHSLTFLLRGHLGLQVLGGDVELGLLVHGGSGFTLSAAAVTAAAQAAAEVAAGGHAAAHKQRLHARTHTHKRSVRDTTLHTDNV